MEILNRTRPSIDHWSTLLVTGLQISLLWVHCWLLTYTLCNSCANSYVNRVHLNSEVLYAHHRGVQTVVRMRCKMDLKFTTLQTPPIPLSPFPQQAQAPSLYVGSWLQWIPAGRFPSVPLALEPPPPSLSFSNRRSFTQPCKAASLFSVISCPILFWLEKTAQN